MEDWTYQHHFELEDRHWWFQARRHVIWALMDRVDRPSSPRMLDAGCGTGRNLMELQRLGPAEGVDVSPRAVEFCRRRGLDAVHEARLEELPFDDDRFDVLLATDVIEHLPDDGPALTELRRVTAPRGHLIITVPAYDWLWSQHDVSFHHFRRYTRRLLTERVRANGWEPVVTTYFFSTMLPPVAAVRALQRFRGNANGKSDFQRTPEALNRWLELVVRGEARLIQRGASLPAGVSLGMVCRVG